MNMKLLLVSFVLIVFVNTTLGQDKKVDTENLQYKLLATKRTSTMQKEIDETAAEGYRILVGAPTSSAEMALFLSREGTVSDPFKYRLLATSRTGTMQKELNQAAENGYRLIPSTMIAKEQVLGGVEVVMILERPPSPKKQYEYRLLATSRTSTLQKEVTEAKEAGYIIVGMVSRGEHMVVMERESAYVP